MSKLLDLASAGKLHKFKGQSLADVAISSEDAPLTEEEEEEEHDADDDMQCTDEDEIGQEEEQVNYQLQ